MSPERPCLEGSPIVRREGRPARGSSSRAGRRASCDSLPQVAGFRTLREMRECGRWADTKITCKNAGERKNENHCQCSRFSPLSPDPACFQCVADGRCAGSSARPAAIYLLVLQGPPAALSPRLHWPSFPPVLTIQHRAGRHAHPSPWPAGAVAKDSGTFHPHQPASSYTGRRRWPVPRVENRIWYETTTVLRPLPSGTASSVCFTRSRRKDKNSVYEKVD